MIKQPPAQKQTKTTDSPLIEDIAIKPDEQTMSTINSGRYSPNFTAKQINTYGAPLEMFSISQLKYAIHLDVPVETLTNASLYNLIDEWWKTPYRMGGTTKKGIDCSAFVQTLIVTVFAVQIPRTAREQRMASTSIHADELREGDLVFFNTRGGVSHVGVFLHNNKFVHASTSGGVMISGLNEDYWKRRFLGAGRIVQPIIPHP
jgi:NlpC/P60 family